MKDFGKRITAARRERGWTQEELAGRLGLTPQAISKWESGVGYPDLMMMPMLAQELGLSLETLFGMSDGEMLSDGELPAECAGLPLVGRRGHSACYSDKQGAVQDGAVIRFENGSWANLDSCEVCNIGAGDIRIVKENVSRWESAQSMQETSQAWDFPPCRSVALDLSAACDAAVVPSGDGQTHLVADGTEAFLKTIRAEVTPEGAFRLRFENHHGTIPGANNRVTVELALPEGRTRGENLGVVVNGSGSLEVRPDFEAGSLRVNGSGAVQAKNFDTLSVNIAGSGDVGVARVEDALTVSVAGSGDVHCECARSASVNIAGSGDLSVREMHGGKLVVKIAGSGDVSCGGTINEASVNISGSGSVNGGSVTGGDVSFACQGSGELRIGGTAGHLSAVMKAGELLAEDLTVRTAEIKAGDDAELTIGRIVEKSMETLGAETKFKVLHRG